jgi:formylglycine-generating enzyme required for sulfatase activity
MPGLPSGLYKRCRETLLKCSEFDSDAALRAVFVTDELRPFRDRLLAAASKSERVDTCLALLAEQHLSDGRTVLPIFLATLRDHYHSGDALYDELTALVRAVYSVLAPLAPPLSGSVVMDEQDLIEVKEVFNGTPRQFEAVVRSFSDSLCARLGINLFGVWRANDNLVNFSFAGLGLIDAQTLPGGKSLLTVSARLGQWPNISEIWELLRAKLIQEGWIDAPETATPRTDRLGQQTLDWIKYLASIRGGLDGQRQLADGLVDIAQPTTTLEAPPSGPLSVESAPSPPSRRPLSPSCPLRAQVKGWIMVALLLFDFVLSLILLWQFIGGYPDLLSYVEAMTGVIGVLLQSLLLFVAFRVREMSWHQILTALGTRRWLQLGILLMTVILMALLLLDMLGPCSKIRVPAGTFWMGSNESDLDAYDDERPRHKVYVDAFWVDRTEVTNDQYRRCVEAGTCSVPAIPDDVAAYYTDSVYGNYPVAYVNWYQAATYCEWAGGRLPTEAEWEYAARGPEGNLFPWGDEFDRTRLNYCDTSCSVDWAPDWPDRTVSDGYARAAPVGSYPKGASWRGALDMAGNVWEWVADWYSSDYYASSAASNPQGPASGESKIIRGGGWDFDRQHIRAAVRLPFNPLYADDSTGFRCAYSGHGLPTAEPILTPTPTPTNTLAPNPTHTPTPAWTPSPTPVCGAPHPPITDTILDGTAAIIQPEGACVALHKAATITVTWKIASDDLYAWLLVYSPGVGEKGAGLYYPHPCGAGPLPSEGSHECQVAFGAYGPYDVVLVLANSEADRRLESLREAGGVEPAELPYGIAEQESLSVECIP